MCIRDRPQCDKRNGVRKEEGIERHAWILKPQLTCQCIDLRQFRGLLGERLARHRQIVAGAAHVLQAVSYTHLRAHETPEHLVCRLLLGNKKDELRHGHPDA